MTPQEFYSQYLPYAEKVSNQTGLDPRLILAQAALETGYGKSAPNMNFFGIKSHGRKGGQTLQTSEFENGQMVNQPASFRGYESPDQSFQDYARFLKSNPRYEGVLSAEGIGNQISAMAKSGYATDPDYGAKLANIAGKFDPSSPSIIASDAMRVLGKQPKGLLVSNTMNTTESEMVPEQKPKGLLGGLFSDPDKRARLAMALEGMTLNPNQGMMASLQGGIEQRRENKLATTAEAKVKAQDNATGQWLIRNGFKAIGEGVLKGELSGAAGLQMSQVAKKPTKVATAIEEFEYAKVNGNLPEGVSSLPEYKKYIARAGRNVPDVTMHPTLNRPLSPIEVSVDNEIAKTFGETVTTGLGAANRNAATIKSVLDRLGSTEEGEALTGPSKGMLGSFGRNVFAPTSQAALNDVSAVVQQSLREILGGQFAQKEGEQLIARAYDISAPPPVNAARLRALYTQLESIAANKAALIDYVEKYGTSAGFSGTTVTPSVDVFYNAMDRAVPQVGPEQGPLLPGQAYTDQELEDAMANFKKSKGGVKQ
tara:strand:+ start:299 stop:1915 length:1617 start_codon:yes stop_codon:yes gene_type:complete